jgi:membrane protease subunit HflK
MDFDQIIARLREGMAKLTARFGGGGIGLLLLGAIGLIAVIWLATGIFTIGPGQQAALQLFGAARAAPVQEQGLQWWWPAPIGKRHVVLVTQTRNMELGFRENSENPRPAEALMISGDLNIVDVQMVVQYNIKNLNDYLFRVDDPGEPDRGIPEGLPDGLTLKDAAEAALRLVVGQRSIDDVLVRNREQVETETTVRLQEILDGYNTGINIVVIQLQDVKAPLEVRPAFDDVLVARQERDTRINQARAFEADIIPRAQGDSERIKEAAEAFRQSRIAQAQGEADRFTSVLNEYENSREVTRQRLYLEAMEETLPGLTKIIVSPDAQTVLIMGGDGSLAPVPLGPNP